MDSRPINDSFWRRRLTLIAVKVGSHRLVRRFRPCANDVLPVARFCIKRKPGTNLDEAHTMRFVAQRTSIPVPRVYSTFTHKGWTYIVMETLPGELAAVGWVKRSDDSKKRILAQLRDMAEQLRAVDPPDAAAVSSIMAGPVRPGRAASDPWLGPFATQDAFHAALRNNLPLDADLTAAPSGGDLAQLLAFHRHSFPRVVLTHGDLSSFNVLVQGDDVVGLVNWEAAGWFPYYWEYVRAWNVSPRNTFWQCEVDKFLTPLPYELEMDRLRRLHFGKP